MKIKSITQILEERLEYAYESAGYEVIYVKNELWLTYGQGSGTTTLLPDLKKYITNKKDDKNYDFLVDKIIKEYSSKVTPLKTKGNNKLFKINEYPVVSMGKKYDIWGGDVKPINDIYMIVNDNGKIAVINFFKSKNEALSWMNSLK